MNSILFAVLLSLSILSVLSVSDAFAQFMAVDANPPWPTNLRNPDDPSNPLTADGGDVIVFIPFFGDEDEGDVNLCRSVSTLGARCITDGRELHGAINGIGFGFENGLPFIHDQIRWYKGSAGDPNDPSDRGDADGEPLGRGRIFTIPDDFRCTERIAVHYPTDVSRGDVVFDDRSDFVVGFKSDECPAPYGTIVNSRADIADDYSDANKIVITGDCTSGTPLDGDGDCIIERGGTNSLDGTIFGADRFSIADSHIRWFVNDPDRSDEPHTIGGKFTLGDDFPACTSQIIVEWPSTVDRAFATATQTNEFNIYVPDDVECDPVADLITIDTFEDSFTIDFYGNLTNIDTVHTDLTVSFTFTIL